MDRLTEYKNGTAVIKDGAQDAVASKLAEYEDLHEIIWHIDKLYSIGVSMLTKEYGCIGEDIIKIADFWAEREKNKECEQDRLQGQWNPTGNMEEWYAPEYACSVCGETMLGLTDFCPYCGAKME